MRTDSTDPSVHGSPGSMDMEILDPGWFLEIHRVHGDPGWILDGFLQDLRIVRTDSTDPSVHGSRFLDPSGLLEFM